MFVNYSMGKQSFKLRYIYVSLSKENLKIRQNYFFKDSILLEMSYYFSNKHCQSCIKEIIFKNVLIHRLFPMHLKHI